MELTICVISRNDGTDEQYLRWKDRQLKIIRSRMVGENKIFYTVYPQDNESKLIKNFSCVRNKMAVNASTDWILMLDADEYINTDTLYSIFFMELRNDKAYAFPRYNYFGDYEHIRIDSGCYPDYQCRLYNKKYYSWRGTVHESINVDTSNLIILNNHRIHHFGWLKSIPFQEKKHARFHYLAGKDPYWRFPNIHRVQLRKVIDIKNIIETELCM
nr:MAG: nucleotide-diphospho sugar transferase [Lokiarchaeota virus Ratatoskr Meg22_1012]